MRRRRHRLGVCAGLLALGLFAGSRVSTAAAQDSGRLLTEDVREFNVSVGENKTLPAADVKSYSEGARGIAEVKLTPDGNQFVIVGQKPGSTTLLLILKDGRQVTYVINVFQRAMETVERELRQLLDGTTGIRIRRVGIRFFIEGGVSTEAEMGRIDRIAALYPEQVESLVVLGGAAADRNLNVRVDFFFVQFDRSSGDQFGINWPSSIGPGLASVQYDLISNSVTSATASIVDQVLPGLDIAATHGWAKVLKHSTVVTSNGSEAKFESGGEQNYFVSNNLTASLTQIEFGTRVRALPRFDPQTNELEVHLVAEVMDLIPPVSAGTDLPGRNVSKLEALVRLKLGQSIVLSGIHSRAERKATSGLPLLSEIPILGALFGSTSRNDEEVEGAMYVVPSVVDAVSRSAREIVDEAAQQYESYSGNLDRVNAWDEAPQSPRVQGRPPAPLGQLR
ncbi:MAG TPA: pilus assembly protein N-terminal domain-containing protein [Polyangiaceae bacterium]|nr:pilus assembly protein N-terminal domain-containing protein [Polyangiaceae bacterium]